MARINVEDSLFRDNRYLKLVIKTGSAPLALGLIVQAWIVAQRFYLSENHTIPLAEWKSQELSDLLIEVGLAEIIGDGVYMKGSEKQFSWLRQRADAGRRGGQAKAEKESGDNPSGRLAVASGRLANASKSKQTLANASKSKQTLANASKSKQTLASYSYSSSYSSSYSNSKNKELKEAPPGDTPPADAVGDDPFVGMELVSSQPLVEKPKASPRGGSPEQRARVAQFIAAYVSAYQTKFGHRPEDLSDPKVRGQILNWAKDHPDIDRACELMQVFFQVDRSWFKVKGYDFLTFRNNLNAIGQALTQGSDSQSGGYTLADFEGKVAP